MPTPPVDPCASCNIQQACCNELTGLRVSPDEDERHFAAHAARLDVTRDGPVVRVSTQDGGPCPNLIEGRCTVYDTRPLECRLFPHTLYVRRATPGHVSLGYHSDTRCPSKAALLASDDEARAMVTAFGRQAFGDQVALHVSRRSPLERLRHVILDLLGR